MQPNILVSINISQEPCENTHFKQSIVIIGIIAINIKMISIIV